MHPSKRQGPSSDTFTSARPAPKAEAQPPQPAQEVKKRIRSEKCSAHSVEDQDKLIERLYGEGYDYLDSVMIYGGEMIIRFKRRAI